MTVVCTVAPQDIAEIERLNKLLVLASSSIVRRRNGAPDPRAPRMAECWQAQAELLRFIDAHPTLIPVLAERARDLREQKEALLALAGECATWDVRDFRMAGSDVLSILCRLGLIEEKEIVAALAEARVNLEADPNAMWTGRRD